TMGYRAGTATLKGPFLHWFVDALDKFVETCDNHANWPDNRATFQLGKMPAGRPTKAISHVKTDVGMVRDHNEDSAWADPDGMFFIVADGMGGHAAGEVASAMAVDEMKRALEAARAQVAVFAGNPDDESRKELVTLLESSVQRAHQSVFERGGRESDKKGMGTTLDVVLIADGEAFVAHVGD